MLENKENIFIKMRKNLVGHLLEEPSVVGSVQAVTQLNAQLLLAVMVDKEVFDRSLLGVVVNGHGDPADNGVPPVVRACPKTPVVGIRTQDSVEEALVVVLVVEQTILGPNDRRSTSDEPARSRLLVYLPFQSTLHQLPSHSGAFPQGWVLEGAIWTAVVKVKMVFWSFCGGAAAVHRLLRQLTGSPRVFQQAGKRHSFQGGVKLNQLSRGGTQQQPEDFHVCSVASQDNTPARVEFLEET